jgi:uncharacterized protein YbjT (DUF2867 family)
MIRLNTPQREDDGGQMGGMTLVIGATGRIGRNVVRYLRELQQPVRIFVRDAVRARSMFGPHSIKNIGNDVDVDIGVGDLTNPVTVSAALKGISRVFLLVGGAACVDPANEINVVRAARAAGVERIVKVSGGPPITSTDSDSPIGRAHWQVERELLDGTPIATILRPSLFAQLLFQRVFAGTFIDVGDGPISYVDVADIARVAAVMLTTSGHGGKVYEVTGGRAVSSTEVFDALQRVTGPLTRKQVAKQPVSDRVPAWYLPHVTAVVRKTALGEYGVQTDVVRSITGRPPVELDEFVTKNRHIFSTLAAAARMNEDAVRALVDKLDQEQT